MRRQRRSRSRSISPALTLALACFLLLALPSMASAETTFTFTGRGFGHGIGMSQYGAKGQAEAGRGYKTILSHYYQGTTVGLLGYSSPGAGNEPVMRVAIQASDSPQGYWTLRGNNADLWVDWEGRGSQSYFVIPKGSAYTFLVSGGNIICRDQNSVVKKTFTGASWVSVWERDTTQPRYAGVVQVSQASGPWGWPNVLYKGSIRLTKGTASNASKLYARNYVYMEDYVRAVVPRESPASWHQEALKAQACAARSYAYVSKKGSSSQYDVYCTTRSQVYNGWGQWVSGSSNVRHAGDSLADPAVDATAGQVVKYGSTVVQAFFHSTSGGHTDDIDKVWAGATPQPYFKGVSDPWDSVSPRHTWGPFTYTASTLRTKLLQAGISPLKVPSQIVGVRVISRTRGSEGRVTSMQLVGADGSSTLLTNWGGVDEIAKVRNALALYDTWFFVNEHTIRLAGSDRYATAVLLSENAFSSADAVVVAGGHAYADALAASSLAGAVEGPVLLTPKTALDSRTAAEIERLEASKVYVVGGSGVVSDDVLAQIDTLPGVSVERVAGADRFETAEAIAEKVKSLSGVSFDGRVILVNGYGYADAVITSGLAYRKAIPVLLVLDSEVPTATSDAIEALSPTRAMVVGGAGVVPAAVADETGLPWSRIAGGADRYSTSTQMAEYLSSDEGFGYGETFVASGISLIDALSGGPLAGEYAGPMLLVRTDSVPDTVYALVRAKRYSIDDCYILGGEGVVSTGVQSTLEDALD